MSDFTYFCLAGDAAHGRWAQPDINFPTPQMVELGLDPEICLDHQPATASEARELAVTWQAWASERSLYASDLADWQDYFERLGRRFHLTEEFKEKGII